MFKKIMKLSLVLTLLLPVLPLGDKAAYAASGNLLINPGFEDGDAAWTFKGRSGGSGAGIQSNNRRSGARGFFLDSASIGELDKYAIEQTVTVPYTGTYKLSGYIATGGSGSSLGIRNAGGEVLSSLTLPQGANYSSAHTPASVNLLQDDQVTIYVNNGTGWTNGDDMSFEYDTSSIVNNLMRPGQFNQMVRIPRSGDYILTAQVQGEGNVTITAGAVTDTFTATGTAQERIVPLTGLTLDQELTITATDGAIVTGYSLLFDVSSLPNEAPTASNIAMSGILWSGQTLNGSYVFADEDGHDEGNSRYQWYVSDTIDGDYEPVEGATFRALGLADADEGKFYRFAVTPVDSFGKAGIEAASAAAGPVLINYVRNYSFDIELGQAPVGWRAANGAALPNNSSLARTGFRFGSLPANTPNAEVVYGLAITQTAVYDLSFHVRSASAGTEIGVRYQGDSSAIASTKSTAPATGYEKVTLTDIVLEKGSKVDVYAKGGEATAVAYLDDVELLVQAGGIVPDLANLFSWKAEKQLGHATLNSDARTITFKVPYGTDVSALDVEMEVSEGAAISPSLDDVDFTTPVVFTITNGEASHSWTASAIIIDKAIALNSSNDYLQDSFNWAVNKTRQFVMTGKSGPINMWDGASGTGPVDYIPSYWAGYYDRSAFYSRDFVHQATGAQIAGLADENYSMFKVFANAANVSRKWYTLWAFNFDGSDYILDYHNDNSFVREVPAQFELVQRAYEQYRWTGDERYINDPTLFNFYTKVMNNYVILHDSNDNGLAEGTGTGNIFAGSSTYNERGSEHPIESGDSVGSQYQAMLAYAGILQARGQSYESERWFAKAAELKTYFNEVWSVMDGYDGTEPGDAFARGLAKDGTKYAGFGKENSWFMPMKLITEPGPRHDAYLAFIEENLGSGIGSTPEAPHNIEAYTYIPDMYFPYNQADLAWKWMKYIIDVKDLPHERAIQGTNGDYPEISYTFISHVIEGMMGIEPNAGAHSIITAPRLPSEVADVEALYIPVGDHEVNVRHNGLTHTVISNIADAELLWEARFYGDFNQIIVDGKAYEAARKDINGVQVSYVTVTVPADGTSSARAIAEVAAAPANITLEAQAVNQGEQAQVPLYASGASGLTAITGEILYDSSLLTIQSLRLADGFEERDVNTSTAGKITFAADRLTALDTDDKTLVAHIVFTASGNRAATAELSLQDVKIFKLLVDETVEVASMATGADIEIRAAGGSTTPLPDTSTGTPVVPPVKPGQADDTIKVKAGTGTQATTIINDTEMIDIAKNKEATQIHIDVDVPAEVDEFAITLGQQGMNSLLSSDKPLVISSRLGEISLNQAVLAQLAGGEAIIRMKAASDQNNGITFTAGIAVNGQPITEFADSVTMTIPYTKKAAEANENIVVYRMDGDRQTVMPHAIWRNGKITFASKQLSTFAAGYNAHAFTDISNHWAANNIAFVTARQLFTGMGDGRFAPNATMTRGMLVTVLGRLHGVEHSSGKLAFTDVAEDQYYAPHIAWAYEHGIVNGKGGDTFAPDQEVTREELARIVVNYMNVAGIELIQTSDALTFRDEKNISSWALQAVQQLQAAGILQGKSNNVFDAGGTATRAEVSKIMQLIIEAANRQA